MERLSLISFLVLTLFLSSFSTISESLGSVGVNYGRIANNLPSATKVVTLLRSQGLTRVKVYDADPAVLNAMAGTGIKLTVDLPNELLISAAKRQSFADDWVKRNIKSYHPRTRIESVAVGNEVFVDPKNTTAYLVPAMNNIHKSLVRLGLDKHIKVSSPIALSALQASYPASSGAFREELAESVFRPMLDFLRRTGSFLMVNAYPFFAYESNSDVIPLEYALFKENPGVLDQNSGLRYHNLFDAQIDAVFAAMDKLGFSDVGLVVTETGWPSKGDENEVGASISNAMAYNNGLVKRILSGGGTPLRPKADLTVFLFALFNENKKFGPTSERNYGLFYPNGNKVYDMAFTQEGIKDFEGNPPAEEIRGGGGGGGKGVSKSLTGATWCVANGRVSKEKLQAALDYACGEGGADCNGIQPEGVCYDPNTIEAHASYAFNSYYQKASRHMGSCFFGGAAYVVTQPPKFGNCEFPTGY